MDNKKRFVNPHLKDVKRSIFDVLLWKTGILKDPVTSVIPPDNFLYPHNRSAFDKNMPSAVWVNHSTFLIHIDGINILTDPVWSNYCSPFKFIGPKRRHEPSLSFHELPKIDYVLISHNHYDHMDKKTIMVLNKSNPNIRWIVPDGVKKWFVKRNIDNVFELSWWETVSFVGENNKPIKIHAVPAQHFSGRKLFDFNHTLWAGYVMEIKRYDDTYKRLYFTGDTGYNDNDFKEIGKKWDKIDLSLIPIGAYAPRKFMKPVHVNPKEAVEIHKDVNSSFSIGMHWKTFNLSDEPFNLPPYDLFLSMKDAKLEPDTFITVNPGDYVNW